MASDLYSNVPELSGEAQAIARRKKIAEMMISRGQRQAPVNKMAGNVVVRNSPLEGLGSILQTYLGSKQSQQADKDLVGLADKRQQMVADELSKFEQMRQGTPAIEGVAPQPERTIQSPVAPQAGAQSPSYQTQDEVIPATQGQEGVPAVQGNNRQAMIEMISSNFPEVRKRAEAMMQLDNRDHQSQQVIAGRDHQSDMQDKRIASSEGMNEVNNDLRAAIANQSEDLTRYGIDRRIQASLKAASLRASSAGGSRGGGSVKIIQGADGTTTAFYPNTREQVNLGVIGKPTATNEKKNNADIKLGNDLSSIIPNLEEISKDGGLIDQSTGSGVGRAVDIAAGVFGHGTEGAVASHKLKSLTDPILKLIPRFEGPQSDKDTQTYRDAAGDLSNPNLPDNVRKGAAKTILEMYKKRKNQFSNEDGGQIESNIQKDVIEVDY